MTQDNISIFDLIELFFLSVALGMLVLGLLRCIKRMAGK
jgi:hypothetical protein